MNDVVILDASPVGLLTNPNNTPDPVAIRKWLADLIHAGRRVVLPEVADYEVRRELIRGGKKKALRFLDALAYQVEYLPIQTMEMRRAALEWARVRNMGLPTSSQHSLDGDAIIAAQALELGVPVIVATSNPAHMRRFLPAEDWRNILP